MSDSVTTQVNAATAAGTSAVASIVTADISVQMFGVPITVVLAAFAGAALALSFLPQMSRGQMLTAVLLGLAFGIYGSQFVTFWQTWPPHTSPPIAFFLGLTGQLGASMLFSEGRAIAIGWLREKAGMKKEGDS